MNQLQADVLKMCWQSPCLSFAGWKLLTMCDSVIPEAEHNEAIRNPDHTTERSE